MAEELILEQGDSLNYLKIKYYNLAGLTLQQNIKFLEWGGQRNGYGLGR